MLIWISLAIFTALTIAASNDPRFDHDDALVPLGDRNVTLKEWRHIQHVINNWVAPNGSWVDHPERPPMIKTVLPDDGSLNTKVYSACGPVEKRRGLNFWWEPETSRVPLYNVSFRMVCEVMRGRNLIFMGDSLSMHHYESTVNVLGYRKNHGTDSNSHFTSETFTECTDLYNLTTFSAYRITKSEVWIFGDAVKKLLLDLDRGSPNGSVVIVNWGAFYKPDEVVAKCAPANLHWLQEALPKALVVFRTSNMAHLNCERYTEPDNVLRDPAPNPRRPGWNWDKFPLQRTIWIDEITNHRPGMLYLDILALSAKRPDQHPGRGDCLHYCIPGPLETWVRLTFSILAYIEDYTRQRLGDHQNS
jgi:hypothetical protein